MSYDFAVLTPESAGVGGQEALAAAAVAFEQGHVAGAEQDRRLRDFVTDLAEAGAADEENGWVSVWPLDIGQDGVAVPTTYADVDSNFITLLRLAARHGLVVVDLNAETVHPPAAGEPIGVRAGDRTRLGALTQQRLDALLANLPPSDPWLVLQRTSNLYVQAYRQGDGTFLLERRDGSAGQHYQSRVPDQGEVARRMWAWITGDATWSADLPWERVTF
jgi:hypothetical protein